MTLAKSIGAVAVAVLAGSPVANAGSTIDFQGTNFGATTGTFSQVVFTIAPTVGAGLGSTNILPYATVNGSSFASYGGVTANPGPGNVTLWKGGTAYLDVVTHFRDGLNAPITITAPIRITSRIIVVSESESRTSSASSKAAAPSDKSTVGVPSHPVIAKQKALPKMLLPSVTVTVGAPDTVTFLNKSARLTPLVESKKNGPSCE